MQHGIHSKIENEKITFAHAEIEECPIFKLEHMKFPQRL